MLLSFYIWAPFPDFTVRCARGGADNSSVRNEGPPGYLEMCFCLAAPLLSTPTAGVYHSGVEVYNEEYAFGGQWH